MVVSSLFASIQRLLLLSSCDSSRQRVSFAFWKFSKIFSPLSVFLPKKLQYQEGEKNLFPLILSNFYWKFEFKWATKPNRLMVTTNNQHWTLSCVKIEGVLAYSLPLLTDCQGSFPSFNLPCGVLCWKLRWRRYERAVSVRTFHRGVRKIACSSCCVQLSRGEKQTTVGAIESPCQHRYHVWSKLTVSLLMVNRFLNRLLFAVING